MTRKLALGVVLVAAVAAAGACQSQEQKKEETKAAGAGGAAALTEDEKVVYVIGLRIGGQATILHLSPGEVEALKRGVADAATGKKPEVDPDAYGPKVQPFAQGRMQKAAEASASAAPILKQKGVEAKPSDQPTPPVEKPAETPPAAAPTPAPAPGR